MNTSHTYVFFLDIHFCNRLISYIPYLTWLFREGRAFHSPSGWLGQDVRPADGAGGAAPPGVSGEDQGSGASEGPWGSLGPWGPLVGNHHYFFFYASRSSMNRQFSSIFHCYTLNFRRLSMIDPTGEGFFHCQKWWCGCCFCCRWLPVCTKISAWISSDPIRTLPIVCKCL